MGCAASQAFSVMKTCLFGGDGFSLQGYEAAFRHECSVSSIVKPQSPRGASPSGAVCSQSSAFESFGCQVRECWCSFGVSVLSLRLATIASKTLWCARGKATVVCVFILSHFCFVCAFVLSAFLLTFDVVWLVVGRHSLSHLPQPC